MDNRIDEFIGDDFDYTLTFTDDNGDAVDITGWTIWLTVKESEADADVSAVFQVSQTSHTDATGGISTLSVANTTTDDLSPGTYVYDIQVKTDSNKIYTVTKGQFVITSDVTTSTT